MERDNYFHNPHHGECGHENGQHPQCTLHDYLKGKVADFTVSDNAIESICVDRGLNPATNMDYVGVDTMKLCYADLLRYIYTQPGITKSYSQTNGTWSQKEGATQMSELDKRRILDEMNRNYVQGGEPENVILRRATMRMDAHGLHTFHPQHIRNRR